MPRLRKPFWDVDLRLGHFGLRDYASRRGWKLKDLEPGDFLLFVNRELSACKTLSSTGEVDSLGIVCGYKSPHGRMEPHAFQYIAKTFSGGSFDYDEALRESLEERIKPKRRNVGKAD